jgi:hypothetical protein
VAPITRCTRFGSRNLVHKSALWLWRRRGVATVCATRGSQTVLVCLSFKDSARAPDATNNLPRHLRPYRRPGNFPLYFLASTLCSGEAGTGWPAAHKRVAQSLRLQKLCKTGGNS